jgi:hypothetical protein
MQTKSSYLTMQEIYVFLNNVVSKADINFIHPCKSLNGQSRCYKKHTEFHRLK